MSAGFTHPVTYETLETTEANLASAIDDGFKLADTLKHERAQLFARMEPLRIALADMRGPAKLPPAPRRSRTQDEVAACPRCGGDRAALALLARTSETP